RSSSEMAGGQHRHRSARLASVCTGRATAATQCANRQGPECRRAAPDVCTFPRRAPASGRRTPDGGPRKKRALPTIPRLADRSGTMMRRQFAVGAGLGRVHRLAAGFGDVVTLLNARAAAGPVVALLARLLPQM